MFFSILAQVMVPQPVQATFVDAASRRVGSHRLERVELSFTNRSAVPIAMRACAQGARLESFARRGSGWAREDAATAFGVGAGGSGSWTTGCRTFRLEPGRAQAVAYYLRPGRSRWPERSGRTMRVETSVGSFVVVSGPPAPPLG